MGCSWAIVDPEKQNDEAKFNEAPKRILSTPPKSHSESARPKPDTSRSSEKDLQKGREPVKRGSEAKQAKRHVDLPLQFRDLGFHC